MDNPSADPYEQGWQQALRTAGLEDGPIASVGRSREGGYEGGHRLLNSPNPPSAISTSSDLKAAGEGRVPSEPFMDPGCLQVEALDNEP